MPTRKVVPIHRTRGGQQQTETQEAAKPKRTSTTRRPPLPKGIREVLEQIVEPAMARIQTTVTISRLTLPNFLMYAVKFYEDQWNRYGGIIPASKHPGAEIGLIPYTEIYLLNALERADAAITGMKDGLDTMLQPYYSYRPVRPHSKPEALRPRFNKERSTVLGEAKEE